MPQGTVEIRDAEKVRALTADFQPRWDNAFHWSRACSEILALPALRAFYPMSSVVGGPTVPPGGNCNDISGNGLTLTYNGNPVYGYSNLVPYVDFDGTGDYLSYADTGANDPFDIIGNETYIAASQRGLTIGGWFQFDDDTSNETLVSKYDATVNQRSYFFHKPINILDFTVSQNGVAIDTISSTGNIDTVAWWYCAVRFVPSTSLSVFRNDEITSKATAVATLWNSTTPFLIGAVNAGAARLLDGRASMIWVCAAALSNAQILALYDHQKAMFNVR